MPPARAPVSCPRRPLSPSRPKAKRKTVSWTTLRTMYVVASASPVCACVGGWQRAHVRECVGVHAHRVCVCECAPSQCVCACVRVCPHRVPQDYNAHVVDKGKEAQQRAERQRLKREFLQGNVKGFERPDMSVTHGLGALLLWALASGCVFF
jgi:hypothetical protein